MNTPKVIPADEAMNPWPEPQDIGAPLPPKLDLLACIPDSLATLRDFTRAVSTAFQVPPDAIFPQVLGIASGCAARSIETRVSPQWVETAVLWVLVQQESAEKKSPVLSLLMAAVREWERQQRDSLSPAVAEREESRRVMEERLKALRAKLAKLAPGPDYDSEDAERRDLTQKLLEMPTLKPPRILIDDATPEAMRDLLGVNGEKAIWATSEIDGAGLLGTRHDKQGAPNINLLLKAKNGEPFHVDRAGGRAIDLERPAVALVLSAQPIALQDVLADPYAAGRGLVPRFAVVCPISWVGSRDLNPASIPPLLLAWWSARLGDLLALPWPGKVVLDGGPLRRHEGPPRTLELEAEALRIFDEMRRDIEPRLGAGGDLNPVQAYAGKLAGDVVRVAAVFTLLADSRAERIPADAMRAAVASGWWMLAHTRYALGDAGLSEDERDARKLLATLRRRGSRAFSARDAKRALDQQGHEPPAALTVLDDMGWTRLATPPRPPVGKNKGGRPPGPIREVNPKLFDG